MLKEKRNKGFFPLFIIGFLMLAVAVAIFILISSVSDDKKLEQNGYFFTGEGTKTAYNQYALVDIYGIMAEPIAAVDDRGTVIWLVIYEDGYVGLEAKEDDPLIKELVAKGNELKKKPQRLKVKYYRSGSSADEIIDDYRGSMVAMVEPSSETGQHFSYYSYLSYQEAKQEGFWLIMSSLLFAGMGLFFIVLAFVTKSRINRFYNEFYQTYPELNGDISQLPQRADFHDEQLKIIIYKDHLVVYYRGLASLNLRDTIKLYHHVQTVRQGFFVTNRNSNLMAIKEGSKKKQRLPFKNVGKGTDQELQATFSYIHQQFPHIHLGV